MMAESISKRASMFMAMFAMAMIATLMSASLAFADTYVDVKFQDPADSSITVTEQVNLTALAAAATSDNDVPYFGQFYKEGWTVLATSADNYVPVKEVLQDALDQYNDDEGADYNLPAIWSSSNTLKLTALDGDYTKYNPTYGNVMSSNYFYNDLTNATTAFSATGWSTPWTLAATGGNISVVNPQTAGAVLALAWGQNHIASTDTTTTCATAAGSAYNGIASSSVPRMFYGANSGDINAGKRFCSDITGITIQ